LVLEFSRVRVSKRADTNETRIDVMLRSARERTPSLVASPRMENQDEAEELLKMADGGAEEDRRRRKIPRELMSSEHPRQPGHGDGRPFISSLAGEMAGSGEMKESKSAENKVNCQLRTRKTWQT
jgi:hypothetical protein